MRLIDADYIIEELEAKRNNWDNKNAMHRAMRGAYVDSILIVRDAPTVETEPVRHGRWEWESGYVGTQARCSVCKRSPIGFYSLPKSQIGRLPEFPFCPKCGAKMEGGDE